jgi:hypothetical protein
VSEPGCRGARLDNARRAISQGFAEHRIEQDSRAFSADRKFDLIAAPFGADIEAPAPH